jgi:hypothetical protein
MRRHDICVPLALCPLSVCLKQLTTWLSHPIRVGSRHAVSRPVLTHGIASAPFNQARSAAPPSVPCRHFPYPKAKDHLECRLRLVLRLPEFNLVSFWIQNPGKATVGVAVIAPENSNALGMQSRNQGIHIVDGIVDHEFASRWCEVLR